MHWVSKLGASSIKSGSVVSGNVKLQNFIMKRWYESADTHLLVCMFVKLSKKFVKLSFKKSLLV